MVCAKGRTPSRPPPHVHGGMAPPLELIDDAVVEILLRLPPSDSACLVRASLVCKPWRRVLSDPAFPHRYRAFHRTPPLLGFLRRSSRTRDGHLIVPTIATRLLPFLQPPSMSRPLDCRHGRVLLEKVWNTRGSLAVWDPITGDHSMLPELDCWPYIRCGVVVCAAAGCDHHDCHGGPFQVVFVATADGVARAWVYSSETAAWSEPTSVQLHGHSSVKRKRGAVVGDKFYFLLNACTMLLKFDLGKHRLSMIDSPQYMMSGVLMSMEDGCLGLADINGSNLHLWSRKVSLEGLATKWVPYRVVELGKLLDIDIPYHRVDVIGFAEGIGVLLVVVDTTVFVFELKSGQVRKVSKPGCYYDEVFPFTSFYVPDFTAANCNCYQRQINHYSLLEAKSMHDSNLILLVRCTFYVVGNLACFRADAL